MSSVSPLISVVIPTFNRARSVGSALRSVLGQSFRDFEIVVVDDHSADETDAVVVGMPPTPSNGPIRYIRLDRNRGANHARNIGITSSRGAYVAFLDSDDIWHARKLDLQLKAIAAAGLADNPVLCYSDRYRMDKDSIIFAYQKSGDLPHPRRRLQSANVIGTLSSVLVDRATALDLGFNEGLPACQDWDFYLRAESRCRFLRVPLPLTSYSDGQASRISLNSRRRAQAHLQIYKWHLRGNTTRRERSELFRNLAEDFTALHRQGLARRFYCAYLASRNRYLRALYFSLPIVGLPDILALRYANYARHPILNPILDGSEIPMLDEFNAFMQAERSAAAGLEREAGVLERA